MNNEAGIWNLHYSLPIEHCHGVLLGFQVCLFEVLMP